MKSYLLRDERGRYYQGHMEGGEAICDTTDRDEALEMTDTEINFDFPEGIPSGWVKEKA